MYKIYIDKTAVILADESSRANWKHSKDRLIASYRGKKTNLFNYIDLLEKSNQYASVILLSKDLEKLKADFFSIYKIKEAAGGIVENPDKEILMIFRLDHWDLPKGKIEEGESPAEAAVREVQEETGLDAIELLEPLETTYHTFKNRKGNRVLKPTYWFKMKSPKVALTPQAEEDIEEAVWMKVEDVLNSNRPIWSNIKNLLLDEMPKTSE